jgi:hypothetical protein
MDTANNGWEYLVLIPIVDYMGHPRVGYINGEAASDAGSYGPDLYEYLAKLGSDGWEMVSVGTIIWSIALFFKRPKA